MMVMSFIDSVVESFMNNLIAEDRYRMILDGLQVTLLITLFAVLLGTLLGGLVCWMRMSRRAWLRRTASVYIDLMRGTPVLVLLMLMYFVIMAPMEATGIVVAIVTFAMNTAAYISEMLRTTIQGIDRGQTEAGLALGYSQRQTFFRIVLPQVVRAVMPVYQGEIISLLKGTSIVGYIAVADMTRASDLIRARTFDAFFPLLVTAIIYFLVAWLIGLLLKALVQRKRMKAGVVAMLLVLLGLAGYQPSQHADAASDMSEASAADTILPINQLNNLRIAVILGAIQDLAVSKNAPHAEILRLSTTTDIMAALDKGKVDAAVDESLTFMFDKKLSSKYNFVNAGLPSIPLAACFRLDNTDLQQDFNSYLAEIRADGTYQEILDRWRNADDPSAVPVPQQTGKGRLLHVAVFPSIPPFNFISYGKPSGLEINYLTEWANRRGWRIEYLTMDFASQIPAVQTGKADMAMGGISATEERKKQVLFSNGYVDSHSVVITRKGETLADLISSPKPQEHSPWFWVALLVIVSGAGAWLAYRRQSGRHSAIQTADSHQDTPDDTPIIRISHLKKSYGTLDVLQDINLDVHRGKVISIIGPSGTGKSTFLRCLNRLEQPTAGSIIIGGQDMLAPDADVSLLRQKMGMVFQSFNLFNGRSVLDNITMAPIELLGMNRQEAERQGLELLAMVGLAERADAMPDQLSGGQKQRVAIARALAMKPEILLFDEPTSALDPTMVSEVLGVMTRLARDGMTMIVVTHEMRFAQQVSSRVLFFADGVVYEDGTPEQLFDHPQRELTRKFIRQIHETTFLIESEHSDLYAMVAQMEQFCQRYNLTHKQTQRVMHVIDELLIIIGTAPGTRLTLSYTEQNEELGFAVSCPQPIDPAVLSKAENELSVSFLRHFSRDISIEGNTLRLLI